MAFHPPAAVLAILGKIVTGAIRATNVLDFFAMILTTGWVVFVTTPAVALVFSTGNCLINIDVVEFTAIAVVLSVATTGTSTISWYMHLGTRRNDYGFGIQEGKGGLVSLQIRTVSKLV